MSLLLTKILPSLFTSDFYFKIPISLSKKGAKSCFFSKKKLFFHNHPNRFHFFKKTISDYLSQVQTPFCFKFTENSLWYIVDQRTSNVTLQFLLKNDHKLISIFQDIDDLACIIKHRGSLATLQIICDDAKRIILLQRIGSSGLVKLSSSDSASHILNCILDNLIWTRLTSLFKASDIIKLLSRAGSHNTLTFLFKGCNFNVLQERLTKKGIIAVCNSLSSLKLFQLFLDDKSWSRLSSYFNLGFILNVVSKCGCLDSFNLFLDLSRWSLVLSRIDETDAIRLLAINFSKKIFDIIEDNHLWSIVCCILSKSSISAILKKSDPFNHLNCFINRYKVLSNYLSINLFPHYVLLDPLDQDGLTDYTLLKLTKEYGFLDSEIISMSRLGSRHFPKILRLLDKDFSFVDFLFTSQSLPRLYHHSFLFDFLSEPHHSFNLHSLCFVSLLEYQSFCLSKSLSLNDFNQLASIFPSSLDSHLRSLYLQKVLSLVSFIFSCPNTVSSLMFIPSSCSSVVNSKDSSSNFNWSVFSFKYWIVDSDWYNKLKELTPFLLNWFLHSFSHFIHDSLILNLPISFQSFPDDTFSQSNFLECFRYSFFRSKLLELYGSFFSNCDFSSRPLFFFNYSKDHNFVFVNSKPALSNFDWLFVLFRFFKFYEMTDLSSFKDPFLIPPSPSLLPKLHSLQLSKPLIFFKSHYFVASMDLDIWRFILQPASFFVCSQFIQGYDSSSLKTPQPDFSISQVMNLYLPNFSTDTFSFDSLPDNFSLLPTSDS